jgi:autotransporter-associated beta strand protein
MAGLNFSHAAKAQSTQTWDPGLTGSQSDGSGNWDTSTGIWANGGSDGTWSNGNNAVFGSSGTTSQNTVTLSSSITANNLTFNNTNSSSLYTLNASGNTLNFNYISSSGGANFTNGTFYLGSGGLGSANGLNLTLGAGASLYIGYFNGGTLTFNGGTYEQAGNDYNYTSSPGSILIAAGGMTYNTSGTLCNIGSQLQHTGSGTDGGLTVTGGGTLLLNTSTSTKTNTYNGGTFIDGATLELTSANGTGDNGYSQLPAGQNVTINSGGELLIAGGGDLLGYNSGAPNIQIDGGTLYINSGGRATLQNFSMVGGSVSSGSGSGDGNGNYSFNGNMITATSDANGNPAQINCSYFSLQNGAATTFNVTRGTGASDLTVSAIMQPIYGSGTGVTLTGGGIMMLTASNTYTGATTITNGTLELGSGGNIARSSSITTAAGGTFALNNSNSVTVAQSITNNGTIQFAGGTATLSGAIANNGTIQLAGGTATLSGAITGGGAIRATGGTGTLSGSNTYSGGTLITAGTLTAASTSALGTGPVTLSGGTLVAGSITGVSVNGFGSFTTTQGSGSFTPNVNGSVLNLTDQHGGEANSGFTSTPITLAGGGFTASFTYNHTTGGPYGPADGIAFVVQNDPRGASAVGFNGGDIGYAGPGAISNSGAIEFETYNAYGGYGSNGFGTNGAINEPNSVSFLQGNSPINVTLVYNASASTLVETLTDNNGDSASYTTTGVDFSSLLGGNTGYIGFTGGTGGNSSLQSIGNFSFASTEVSAGSYSNAVVLTAGTTSAINVPAATGASSASVGNLSVGTGATLNVSEAGYYANSAFSLTTGSVAVSGSATFNTFNNGTGAGALILGALSDGGVPTVITLGGTGTVEFSAAGSLISASSIVVSSGSTLVDAAAGSTGSALVANNGTVQLNVSDTLNLGSGAGNFVLNGNTLAVTAASPATLSGVISDGSTSGSSLNISSGVVTLSASNTFTGPTTVLSGATLNVTGTLSPAGAVTASGTVHFGSVTTGGGSYIRPMGVLTITSGGLVTVGWSTPQVNRSVLVPTSLNIAGSDGHWTGKLDLSNNDLDVPMGNLATITNQVAEGYNGGAWNGPGGIVSSAAAADSTHLTALGVIQNSITGSPSDAALYNSFDGQPVLNTDVLVKYTYYGDTDLSGVVDGSDYSRIDYAYAFNQTAASGTALTGWFNGDFNYDGVIDGSDYTLIDNAFNNQGASLAAAVATAQIASTSAVPEPTLLSVIGIGAIGLLGQRRR